MRVLFAMAMIVGRPGSSVTTSSEISTLYSPTADTSAKGIPLADVLDIGRLRPVGLRTTNSKVDFSRAGIICVICSDEAEALVTFFQEKINFDVKCE